MKRGREMGVTKKGKGLKLDEGGKKGRRACLEGGREVGVGNRKT